MQVFWALGLLHELIIRDVATVELRRATRVLHAALFTVLASSEAEMQRNVLRVIGLLLSRQPRFGTVASTHRSILLLVTAMGSGDSDVAIRAATVLHALVVAQPRAAVVLGGVHVGLERMALIAQQEPRLARRVAETFGQICNNPDARESAIGAEFLKGIASLAASSEDGVHAWAASMVLILLETSTVTGPDVAQAGLVAPLSNLVRSGAGQVPAIAAAALALLVFRVDDSSNSGADTQAATTAVVSWLSQGSKVPYIGICNHPSDGGERIVSVLLKGIAGFSRCSPWTSSSAAGTVATAAAMCLRECDIIHHLATDASCRQTLALHGVIDAMVHLLGLCVSQLVAMWGLVDEVLRRHGVADGNILNSSLPRDALDTSALLDIIHASPLGSHDNTMFDDDDDAGESPSLDGLLRHRQITSTPRTNHRPGERRRSTVSVMVAPTRPLRRASTEHTEEAAIELREQELSPVESVDELVQSPSGLIRQGSNDHLQLHRHLANIVEPWRSPQLADLHGDEGGGSAANLEMLDEMESAAGFGGLRTSESHQRDTEGDGSSSPSSGLPVPHFFRLRQERMHSPSPSTHPLSALRRMPPRTPSMAGMEAAAAVAREALARSGSVASSSPPSAVSARIARRLLGRPIDPAGAGGLFAPSADDSMDGVEPFPSPPSVLFRRHTSAAFVGLRAPHVRVDSWTARPDSGRIQRIDWTAVDTLDVNLNRSLMMDDMAQSMGESLHASFDAVVEGRWADLDVDATALSDLDTSLSGHADSDSEVSSAAMAAGLRADLLHLPSLSHGRSTQGSPGIHVDVGLDTTRSLETRVSTMRHVRDVAEALVTALAGAALNTAQEGTEDGDVCRAVLVAAVPRMWAALHTCSSPQVAFWASSCLSTLAVSDHNEGDVMSVDRVNVEESTSNVGCSPDGLVVRNDGWTFETAVSTGDWFPLFAFPSTSSTD
jgi:hypothetical protein